MTMVDATMERCTLVVSEGDVDAKPCPRRAHEQLMEAFSTIISGRATSEDFAHYIQVWFGSLEPVAV